MNFLPPLLPLGDWHTQEHHLISAFQLKKRNTCHKGKQKMQHQPKCHLGTREWEVPLPTSRKKSKQASSPCHSGSCPRLTGTTLQHLPFLPTLSLHPSPSMTNGGKTSPSLTHIEANHIRLVQVHPRLGTPHSWGRRQLWHHRKWNMPKVMALPTTEFSSTQTCCWGCYVGCAANIKNVNFVKVWRALRWIGLYLS